MVKCDTVNANVIWTSKRRVCSILKKLYKIHSTNKTENIAKIRYMLPLVNAILASIQIQRRSVTLLGMVFSYCTNIQTQLTGML